MATRKFAVAVATLLGSAAAAAWALPRLRASLRVRPGRRVSPDGVRLLVDAWGYAVSTPSSVCVASLDRFMEQVLAYGRHWAAALAAVEADEVDVLAALFALDMELARERIPEALAYLQRARVLAAVRGYDRYLDGEAPLDTLVAALGLTPDDVQRLRARGPLLRREQLYVDAYEAWLSGRTEDALVAFADVCREYPRDLFALKRAQLVAFLMGRADEMLRLARMVQGECKEMPYFQGILAFALEQNDMLEQAEVAGRRGDAILPSDAWSHHGVAHALFRSGRHEEGVAFLEPRQHHWRDCMSFMYTHNYFHLALHFLALRQFERLEAAFDRFIWLSEQPAGERDVQQPHVFPNQDRHYSQDQLGALGLLWKYELHTDRHKLDARWADILDTVKLPTPHFDLFFDLVVLNALVRAGRLDDAHAHVASLREAIKANPSDSRRAELERVVLPVAEALLAWGDGRVEDALAVCTRDTMAELRVIGGSSEQREVFHDWFATMLKTAGKHGEAVDYAKIEGLCIRL